MSQCERIDDCAFFATLMKDQSSLAGLFRQRYCRGKAHECARMMVDRAGVPVPDDLFPNQAKLAAEIIGAIPCAKSA